MCARVSAALTTVRGRVESKLTPFPPSVPALLWQGQPLPCWEQGWSQALELAPSAGWVRPGVGQETTRARGSFQPAASLLSAGVSRHVYVLLKSSLGFWQPSLTSDHWFQASWGELSLRCWAPGLGGLLCDSRLLLPREDPWVHDIPSSSVSLSVGSDSDHSLFCFSYRTSCGSSLFPPLRKHLSSLHVIFNKRAIHGGDVSSVSSYSALLISTPSR